MSVKNYNPKNDGGPMRSYNITVLNYFASKNVTVEENCAGFMLTNIGDVNVTVNGMLLYAGVPGTSLGDSISIGANEGDIYKGNLQIAFAVPTAGVAPNLQIVQLYYASNYNHLKL